MADFDPIAAGGIPYSPTGGAAPQIAQPATAEGAPIAAGMPPGFEDTTKAAAAQQIGMTTRAQNYANDMFPLYKAKQQLALAPTGAGSDYGYQVGALASTVAPEWLHRTMSYVTNLGGMIGGGVMTPEETAAYAEANKYLTQAQLGVAGATRSNEGGQTASAASPSVHIPKAAAQVVLQGMIGLRRMEQDQTMQWQQSGLAVQQLPQFVAKFQTNADPRVYVWDQLSKSQQSKIFEGMSPAQQGAFITKVNQAKANGIYNTMGMDAPQ